MMQVFRNNGFTLIEVIATILATAILSAIFINFMGSAMSRSVRPIEMVSGETEAEGLLEWVLADYVYEINRNPGTALGTIKGYIDSPTRRYGTKVSAAYVAFNNGIEEPAAGGNTLKVTVSAAGNDLVTLLTRTRSNISPPVPF
jgi:prepilin-type N-terminal cleavage/methylation domain-containing protein